MMAQPGGTMQAGTLAERLSETPGGAAPGEAAPGCVWTLLPRHGRRPLRFVGRAMLRADNRAVARAQALPHWSEIEIYEAYPGGFVAAVRHVGGDAARIFWQDAWLASDAAGVVTLLRNHDGAASVPHTEPGAAAIGLRQAWLGLLRAIFGVALAG